MIADDATLANESSDLLAHLIRNACVNDGTPESGFEGRSTDVLAQYLGDTRLELERYTAQPGRENLVARLDGVKVGLPAHGNPFADVPGRARAIQEHHAERMELLRSAGLALGPATVPELSHEVFPKRHWGTMAESETFAHLEHMVNAGIAERWEEGGMLHYRVAEAS